MEKQTSTMPVEALEKKFPFPTGTPRKLNLGGALEKEGYVYEYSTSQGFGLRDNRSCETYSEAVKLYHNSVLVLDIEKKYHCLQGKEGLKLLAEGEVTLHVLTDAFAQSSYKELVSL